MSQNSDTIDRNSVVLQDGTQLIGRFTATEIYCDGITQLMLGSPVSRIVCHTVLEPAKSGSAEIRRVAATICMPTAALVEMALNILSAVKENEERYILSNASTSESSVALINSFSLERHPTAPKE